MVRKSSSKSPSNVASIRVQSEVIALDRVRFAERRLRHHSQAKRKKLACSMERHSQLVPIVINAEGMVIDGRARVEVARELGWTTIVAVRVEHLTPEDLRLFAIAANKFVEDAAWDLSELRVELDEIETALPTIDLTLSGFSNPEIDTLRGAHRAAELNDLVDELPPATPAAQAIAQIGDVFELGQHRLICGDALKEETLTALMDGQLADQMFTDPPYNVAIQGHVSGKGKVKHREFAMASGEMDYRGFVEFLRSFLTTSVAHLSDGALAYVCMDHAHLGELLEASAAVFTERKAICVWDKGAGGMGSLYRNAYELVTVFKAGTASHINNVELGKHGRYRTTVWRYPGMAQLGKGRAKALESHPTVKPVALVADAILDASPANGTILDPFGGSGTTLIAAEVVGRRARLVELDPIYVDTIIARFETLTGQPAIHVATGLSFAELRDERTPVAPAPALDKTGY